MARTKEPSSQVHRIQRAKQLLAGGGVARDDSDDELGLEDHPWQYIRDPDGKDIVGARMGSFECRLGDAVLLKAEGTKEAWVALLCDFGDIEPDAEDEEESQKAAYFMWFSTDKEIRNKQRKRTDCLPHEMYITPSWDWNPLTTINGKASILSYKEFQAKWPSLKIPRASREYGKTFLCRRGCNTRTAKYTEEFDWGEIYSSEQDIHVLAEQVKKETWSARKRKRAAGGDEDYDARAPEAGEVEFLQTPSKKRKLASSETTPSRTGRTTPSKLTTPRHRKMLVKKPLEYSPLATRVLSPRHISSPFQKARSQLHVAAVPTSLPCREEAFATVYTHLEAAIIEGSGSCIYISGTPGTGKTATVREVITKLDLAVQNEELDDFIFVEINGMKVTEPQQAYVQLWQALRGETVSPAHALDLLEREFTHPNPRRVPCVVLMDELDQLVTKNQSVMYNFFNWPSLRHSRLIVLAVANTMDLPERTLSNKISSRLGLTRIPFAGYNHNDLIKIIQSRLEGVPGNIVDPDAVQFASRKVAAVSGDARRALDICRRAVEMAEAESLANDTFAESPSNRPSEQQGTSASLQKRGRVTIATIKRAISEATSTPVQQALRALSISAKLVLAALVAHTKRTGVAESSLGEVVEGSRRFAMMSEEPWVRNLILPSLSLTHTPNSPMRHGYLQPRPSGLGFATEELVETGIFSMESKRGDRLGKIRLNVSEEEIRTTLKEDSQVGRLGFAS